MSPNSNSSMQRVRVGSAILLICLSLPVADRLREELGAELAAFCVFATLFMTWFAIGLAMDALWGKGAGQAAEPGYPAKGQYLSQP